METAQTAITDVPLARRKGQFIAALGLEEKVLANGVLPTYTVNERVGIVQGMADELLSQGRWEEAVKMAFNPKSGARLLFELSPDFSQNLVASIKSSGPRIYDYDAFTLLAQHGMAADILQVAREVPYTVNALDDLFTSIRDYLSPKHTQEFSELIGKCAEGSGDIKKAIQAYVSLKDTTSLQRLFTQYTQPGVNHDDNLFNEFLEIAMHDSNRPSRKEMLTKLVQSQLTRSVHTGNIKHAKTCFTLFKQHRLHLEKGEIVRLYGHAARAVDYYDLSPHQRIRDEQFPADDRLKLLWAQLNTEKYPQNSYIVFTSLDYYGHESLAAARIGLALGKNYQQISEENIRGRDANLLLYDKRVSLLNRYHLATRFSNNETVLELSKEAAEKKDNRIAYHLWVEAGGPLEDPHFTSVRQQLMDEAINDKRYVSFSFLSPEDTIGRAQAHQFYMSNGHYKKACEFSFPDREKNTYYAEARDVYLAADPVDAYEFFSSKWAKDAPDSAAADSAFALIAGRHGLSVDDARAILPHIEAKR